jgi:hypothetical protein
MDAARQLKNMGHPDTIRSPFDSGILKGSITQGRQRYIFIAFIREEEARMIHRAETRKIEQRLKKRNANRRMCSIEKEKLERVQANFTKSSLDL